MNTREIEPGSEDEFYDESCYEQFVCPCKSTEFNVFHSDYYYQTWIECLRCGIKSMVHTG